MQWLVCCVLLGPVATERDVAQQGGDWEITYRVYAAGPAAGFTGAALTVHADGDLSNSAVPGHGCPVRVVLDSVWPVPAVSTGPISLIDAVCKLHVAVTTPELVPTARGPCYRFQLKLGHRHAVYGEVDPLYGRLQVTGQVWGQPFQDDLVLEPRPPYYPATRNLFVIPEERRDTAVFRSPPDSLYIAAHQPGNQYYRSRELPVRYGTKMRLRFWYLIAPGTEGECRVRLAQYKDTPTAWRALNDGAYEECLPVVGRWAQTEHVFRTEPDATTLALDFRICSADVGELWIDDLELTPAGGPPAQP